MGQLIRNISKHYAKVVYGFLTYFHSFRRATVVELLHNFKLLHLGGDKCQKMLFVVHICQTKSA